MWTSTSILSSDAAEIFLEDGDSRSHGPAPVSAEAVVNAVVVANARCTFWHGPADKLFDGFIIVVATIIDCFAFKQSDLSFYHSSIIHSFLDIVDGIIPVAPSPFGANLTADCSRKDGVFVVDGAR